MDFYCNLTIFYETSPHFEGKWTRFVAVLAQDTCVYGYRTILYYSKVNLGWLGRFMRPQMGIMDNFPVQPHHFLQSQPSFWWQMDYCVAVMAQNICVYGWRLVLHQFKFNTSSLSRFMKPGIGIINGFLLQPHHFLWNKSPFWRKMNSFCDCSGPKYMCVWLFTKILLLQGQHWLIRKVHEAWEGNRG